MILAIEGIDGAGKTTLVDALRNYLEEEGIPVARLGFPRYTNGYWGGLLGQALRGKLGDMHSSMYGMGLLFALDRADISDEILELSHQGLCVIIDRYIASNMAYSAARSGFDGSGDITDMPIVQWLEEMEVENLGVIEPDVTIFVTTSPEEAARRVRARCEQDDVDRDDYEKDSELQVRTWNAYHALADASVLGPWLKVDSAVDPAELWAEISSIYTDDTSLALAQDWEDDEAADLDSDQDWNEDADQDWAAEAVGTCPTGAADEDDDSVVTTPGDEER